MSAIWGIVALQPDCSIPANSAQLFEETYRGNCKIDRYESVCTKDALFGCGIQYITKESEKEQLPVFLPERDLLFTADCLLDNREEVIALLSGKGYDKTELTGAPDGTLMYNAYLSIGKDCVNYFRGLFSFAIWEEAARTLTLYSDHTSARSLYYTNRDGLLAFSTRMEPLLKLFPDVTPNTEYHKDFLLANPSVIYVTPGETPYREISLLTPATRLCLTAHESTSTAYWTPGITSSEHCRSAAEYGKRFLALYTDCVRDALRTSGEVGIAMSSGLDSASVGVLAAKELESKNKALHSYTFVPYYAVTPPANRTYVYDESDLVRELAKKQPNIKTTFLNNGGRNPFADVKTCSNLLEMPYKAGTFPNHLEMCTHGSEQGCKVFLNGAFGNRSVSFGDIYNVLYGLYRKKKWLSVLFLTNRYAKHERISRQKMLFRSLKSFHLFKKHMQDPFARFIPENCFLHPGILRNYHIRDRFSNNTRALFTGGYIDRETFLQQINPAALFMYLGVFETQFGLHTGMLLRDPTKDIRLLDFCCHLPFRMYAHGGMPRFLIRSTFASLLPSELLEPWSRQSFLNADRMQRIRRDWSSLKPELLQHLSSGLLDAYINKEDLLSFIESFATTDKDCSVQMSSLSAVEGLLRFLLPE